MLIITNTNLIRWEDSIKSSIAHGIRVRITYLLQILFFLFFIFLWEIWFWKSVQIKDWASDRSLMAGTRIWEEERKFMISVGSMECSQFCLKTCFGVRFGFCGLLWAYVGIRMGSNSNLNRAWFGSGLIQIRIVIELK